MIAFKIVESLDIFPSEVAGVRRHGAGRHATQPAAADASALRPFLLATTCSPRSVGRPHFSHAWVQILDISLTSRKLLNMPTCTSRTTSRPPARRGDSPGFADRQPRRAWGRGGALLRRASRRCMHATDRRRSDWVPDSDSDWISLAD
jgi:hypothetical protein